MNTVVCTTETPNGFRHRLEVRDHRLYADLSTGLEAPGVVGKIVLTVP